MKCTKLLLGQYIDPTTLTIKQKGFIHMPPCGFNQKAVKGALQFIQGCYEDLQEEVKEGKHANFEEALKHELGNLEKALTKLHIDKDGEIVERRSKPPNKHNRTTPAI